MEKYTSPFCRWRDKGIWEALLEILVTDPDFEWLMIDATHIKVHPHAAGARSGNQDMGLTKGGSIQSYTWPWMRMVCRSEYLLRQVPLQIVLRLGAHGLSAEYLLADRGYDSNAIVTKACEQGMQMVIPPRKSRKEQREYDRNIYKVRHLVENAFLHLKRWRGIATRYAKNTSSFLAAVHIRCIALWAGIS
ncbi:Mobile element protein [Morganella morganii IS15]|nr:Mobile element protein [Morganella morganii IS15]